jgi:hypothetical protein
MLVLTLGILVLVCSGVLANDSLVIESKSVPENASGVEIRIKFANSDTISGFVMPFEIKQVTQGSFITSLEVLYRERLTSKLLDLQRAYIYTTEDGTCAETGEPAYFAPDRIVLDSMASIQSSPIGLMCMAMRFAIAGSLPPGTDSTGAIVLKFSVTDTPGSFEIDTVCMGIDHHLMYVRSNPPNAYAIVPEFTKSTITIVGCDCPHKGDLNGDGFIDAIDHGILIDHVFGGQPAPPTDSACTHIDRGDVDCSGFDDVQDISYMTDYLYGSGAAPCDPCECNPYPSSCP